MQGLLDLNVSIERIPKDIQKVAVLCSKYDIDRIPAVYCEIHEHKEATLSHLHLAEVLPEKKLLNDETPDRGMTVEGFNILLMQKAHCMSLVFVRWLTRKVKQPWTHSNRF